MELLKSCLYTFLLLILAVYSSAELQPISVDPATQRFVDPDGRERFFHGSNVVVKHFPWHPELEGFAPGTFSEQDMELMQSLGLNVLRLGYMWPGVEPTRGKYNETYIEVIKKIVTLSAKYGIYVLLDMHQDVMSRKFCVEGFPNWAANPGNARNFPEPLHAPYKIDPKTGYPSDEDCAKFPWASYYATEAASVAFQNLYNNTDGLRDSWAAFWAKAALTFRDFPSVIGYELINEPWSGDIYSDPLLMVPKMADRMNLAPAYEVLAKAIRSHDDQKCAFFEPVTWDDYGVGFESVPGGEKYKNRSVLSYHYYHLPDGPSGPVELNFKVRDNDLKRLQCGGMLTEFQASSGDLQSCLKTMATADQYLQSWMGWIYKPYYPSNKKAPYKVAALWDEDGLNDVWVENTCRTYPHAVAGHTIAFNYDPISLEFSLQYETSPKCKSTETLIYLNTDAYQKVGGGFKVSITPVGVANWSSPQKNFVLVDHGGSSGTISVHISPGK
ncbi:predicted protein [Nematostella vectensis]|uniref:Endoglycoceramidase n=1 Tax=Nematostella vectensis TaxID=45351 RepID=A7RV54_NEMVE|nr:predicted protein [Nematostella vectensis]|eukprot:XP_001636753.1 predicted protein [Nematostella vectensis]